MSLVDQWRELAREYAEEVHGGDRHQARFDALLVLAAASVLFLEAVAIAAALP